MSYIINNSRGNVIAIVADGTVNTTATDLTLVGRGVTNYGTAESENYVYLLENFANSTAPLIPILGQLWYNSNTDIISAYSSANTWTRLADEVYVQAQKISPAFSGVPTAPTAANGTSTTQLATTAFVQNQLQSANSIVVSGNITGGNIRTGGGMSATGNITGNYFVGNGSQLSGVTATAVEGIDLLGNTLSPNVIYSSLNTVGNLNSLSVVGNTITGNLIAIEFISSSGSITGSDMFSNGIVSAVGNVYGANFVGNVVSPAGSNINTTGNITGGNVDATGNITGGNVDATGNISGNNIFATNRISATGNITTTNTLIANVVIANSVITNGTSAFRLPNLTQVQRNALTPVNGDMIYNTSIHQVFFVVDCGSLQVLHACCVYHNFDIIIDKIKVIFVL